MPHRIIVEEITDHQEYVNNTWQVVEEKTNKVYEQRFFDFDLQKLIGFLNGLEKTGANGAGK